MNILPIFATSLYIHFSLKCWENILLHLGVKGFKCSWCRRSPFYGRNTVHKTTARRLEFCVKSCKLTTKTNPKFLAAVTRAASSGDWAWYSKPPGINGAEKNVGEVILGLSIQKPPWVLPSLFSTMTVWHRARSRNISQQFCEGVGEKGNKLASQEITSLTIANLSKILLPRLSFLRVGHGKEPG